MGSLEGGIQPSEQARVWSLESLAGRPRVADDRWASCPIVMTSALASETATVNQLGDGRRLAMARERAVREQAQLGIPGMGEMAKEKDENSALAFLVSPFACNLANASVEGLIWQWRLTVTKP